MKERPILFSTEMVKAILAGAKTQTRRVIKPWPHIERGVMRWDKGKEVSINMDDHADLAVPYCPYGQVGDRLWVREAWRHSMHYDGKDCPVYKADNMGMCGRPSLVLREEAVNWKPSIFMPKKYSRITLEVTRVRVERVQEVSFQGRIAEGIKFNFPYIQETKGNFQRLWDSINAKRGYGWESNPWVWVISFKRINE